MAMAIEAITSFGGECSFVEHTGEVYEVAARLAADLQTRNPLPGVPDPAETQP